MPILTDAEIEAKVDALPSDDCPTGTCERCVVCTNEPDNCGCEDITDNRFYCDCVCDWAEDEDEDFQP